MISSLSKRELVAMCELMSREVPQDKFQQMLQSVRKAPTPVLALESEVDEKAKKKTKHEMDFSKYPFQQVAFWVAYFGHEYQGLQCANPNSLVDDGTVEYKLFQAFRKVKLISEDATALDSFSRCGRTDRGVSAIGQVISLSVRSNLPGKPEINYADMLNNSLPQDIIVLATCKVDPNTFNARFTCTSRTYRYFIRNPTNVLNLTKMQQACTLLQGTHDFRNFCKIDLSNTRAFVRRIDTCQISPDSKYVEIKGSGFLWHQIRILMAVLFHVGAGLEQPEIVSELLDITKCPGRPSFTMAEDLPLVLYASEYPSLDWQFSSKSLNRVTNSLERRLGREEIQCEMTRTFLATVKSCNHGDNELIEQVVDLDHDEIGTKHKRNKHVKFMHRQQCKSVQERMDEE
ncbi:tRNA pseudouridine(38-40) synthase [Batrachochytrium salamandrivorans]|nr:tRNA pseudouridine(38-40) synthase [Batrachochytrium salamandrivorans]KAH9260891.1 tRNA pseudouridine(38-40) synthase [Batrachochytrium salamandrivorans]